MIEPQNGTKTHPLTDHAKAVLQSLTRAPAPVTSLNPGVVNRLQRGEYIDDLDLPSPFKVHKGGTCPHVILSRKGQLYLANGYKDPEPPPEPIDEPCVNCGEPIVEGAQIYLCDDCNTDCCTACSENTPGNGLVCDDCAEKRRADLPTLPTFSVHPVWAWALMHAAKDVENRTRKLGPAVGWHYVHATREQSQVGYDNACAFMAKIGRRPPPIEDLTCGAIVGKVHLAGWTTDSKSRWFIGPIAAMIQDSVAFPTPVPASGKQGFWRWPTQPKTEA